MAHRYTYPGAWINTFVAGGLIYLRLTKSENWSSPWHTYLPVPIIYLCLNIFLVVTPFIPPNSDWNADGYPYYAFPLVGTGVLLLGGLYWLVWTRLWPRWGGYGVVDDLDFAEGEEVVVIDGTVLRVGQELGGGRVEEPLLGKAGSRGYDYDSINS